MKTFVKKAFKCFYSIGAAQHKLNCMLISHAMVEPLKHDE